MTNDTPTQQARQAIEQAKQNNLTKLALIFSAGTDSWKRELVKQNFRSYEICWLDKPLTTLPPEIVELINLQQLDLSGNQLMQLPSEIGKLTNLNILGLSRKLHGYFNIYKAVYKQPNELDLSGNQLMQLPSEIGKLTNLQKLNLSGNQLTQLPPEIGQLTNLQQLDLWNNHLTQLPAEIGKLTNLQQLDLSSNQLIQLPPEIGKLTNLQQLDLRYNHLTQLPVEIGKLINLQKLDPSSNYLIQLPTEIGKLANLQKLDLSGNQLTQLPPEIGQLTQLKELFLSYNQLTALPPEIGQLTQLQTLYLENNKLIKLPLEIGKLTNLQTLALNANQLTELPPEIGQLTRLQTLTLSYNQLTELPHEIGRLTQLQQLYLRGNPLKNIPPEILKQEIGAILSYLRSQQKSHALHESKVVLVGQGTVGKTSLVKCLVQGWAKFDPHEPITEGIAITPWKIETTFGTETVPIKLNVWDFGGQEIMHATHQFFMTKRTIYLIVLDSRISEEASKLDYWVKLVRSFGADSPIIVVSNKCDQHNLALNERALQAQFPTLTAFLKTSCLEGTGLQELTNQISRLLSTLPHVRDVIPATWLALKTELEQMEQNYINYINFADYKTLCQAHEVTDPLAQKTLLQLLHDLGAVLSFQDDPLLQDTNVLNPHWVTGGVYRILNDKALQNNGLFEARDLDRILGTEGNYPIEKHAFIINMMKKFELCFDSEGFTDQKFLIPELLPKSQPDSILEFEQFMVGAEPLHFEYHYDFLPSSIITRFIVRLHRFIQRNDYWHEGVLLANNTIQALIKVSSTQKCLTICLTGHDGKREFLHQIRHELEEIGQSIKGLQATAKIPISKNPLIMREYEFLCQMVSYGRDIHDEWVGGSKPITINLREILAKYQLPDEHRELLKRTQRAKSQQALDLIGLRVHPEKFYPEAFKTGLMYYNLKEYSESRDFFVQGHEALQYLRGMLLDDHAQTQLSAQSTLLYERLVHSCLQEQAIEKAFEYAAVAKGRAFVNKLAKTTTQPENLAPTFATQLQTARQLRERISQTKDEVEKLLRDEADAWKKLQLDYPALTALLSPPTLSLEQAQTLANDLNATLVEFYRHAGGWCAFVVTPNSIQHVSLPDLTADLIKTLQQWNCAIESSWGRSTNAKQLKPLNDLYQAAIAPLSLPAEPKRLILALYDDLHHLPFAAARSPQGEYLTDQFSLSFVPSLTALQVIQQQAKRDQEQLAQGLLSVAYSGEQDNYLHNVALEAETIANCFDGSLLGEHQATPAEVIKAARGKSVVHLSCHGKFNRNDPQQSGLRLKEWLTVQQIVTDLRLPGTRLVTMAACETGQAQIMPGEEYVGLLQAMMSAGAQAVVASQWQVDDAATFDLFTQFYFGLSQSDNLAHSLQQAMKQVRTAHPHPYYWAAFQINGLAHEPLPPASLHLQATEQLSTAKANLIKNRRGGTTMELARINTDIKTLIGHLQDDQVHQALTTPALENLSMALKNLTPQLEAIQTEVAQQLPTIENLSAEQVDNLYTHLCTTFGNCYQTLCKLALATPGFLEIAGLEDERANLAQASTRYGKNERLAIKEKKEEIRNFHETVHGVTNDVVKTSAELEEACQSAKEQAAQQQATVPEKKK